jgi:hypothetical protein
MAIVRGLSASPETHLTPGERPPAASPRPQRVLGERQVDPDARGFMSVGIRAVNLHGFAARCDSYGCLTGKVGRNYHPEFHHALTLLAIEEQKGRMSHDERMVKVKELLGE